MKKTNLLWWITTVGGVLGAAAGSYAVSEGPGAEVASGVAGFLALLLGYFNSGKVQ